MRSRPSDTGTRRAAKFVPHRGENRLGRAIPYHESTRRRVSAGAMARCSAPCRRSVRPRSIQATRATIERTAPSVLYGPGTAAKGSGASNAARSTMRSAGRAVPLRPSRGASETASFARPRASGSRTSSAAVRHGTARDRFTLGATEAPDAFADDRDPVGARHTAQAWERRRRVGFGQNCENRCVVHLKTIAALGPFGKCRTAHSACRVGLPEAAADEAEEGQHHDDDQDDPEDAHLAPSVGTSYFPIGTGKETVERAVWLRPGAGAPSGRCCRPSRAGSCPRRGPRDSDTRARCAS